MKAKFRETHGTDCEFVARAPGRVNLIGTVGSEETRGLRIVVKRIPFQSMRTYSAFTPWFENWGHFSVPVGSMRRHSGFIPCFETGGVPRGRVRPLRIL